VFGVALLVAGLTAFYMSRLYFVCFWGLPLSQGAKHAHEAPWIILLVLVILALFSFGAGFVPLPEYVYFNSPEMAHAPGWLPITATAVALCGICSAWFFYVFSAQARDSAVDHFKSFYIGLRRKFYVDEAYLFVTHRIIFALIARPAAWFDRNIVDGAVNLCAWCTRSLGAASARIHTGQIQTYGTWLTLGMIILVFWVLWG
jgi:NADH-quinone oxidoreductase subunit L